MQFTSLQSRATWVLTNIYAPCTDERKRIFLDWFKQIEMPDDVDWLVVGDFNLIRKIEDRNKPGEMLMISLCQRSDKCTSASRDTIARQNIHLVK